MSKLRLYCGGRIIDVYSANHARSHEWPNGQPGGDPVNFYPRSFTQLRTVGIVNQVRIKVTPFYYVKDGDFVVFNGTTINLTDYIPVLTNHAKIILVGLNTDTNLIEIVEGAESISNAYISPINPSIPDNMIPSALIRLNYGDTQILEKYITDARVFLSIPKQDIPLDGVSVSKLLDSDGSPDPALSADATGNLTAVGNLSLTTAAKDIFIAGDEAGVKARSVDIFKTSITDHWDGSAFTDWSWASYSGFVTPGNIRVSTFPSMVSICNSNAQGVARAFAYRATFASTIQVRCIPTTDVRCGLRMDDGSENNYAELFLETVSGLMKLRYRFAAGGVVTGPTDWWSTSVPAQFTTLQMIRSGNLALMYYTIDGPNFSYHGVAVIAGWAPARSGIYHENINVASGNSVDRSSLYDWYKQ